jgi:hypothetical protein
MEKDVEFGEYYLVDEVDAEMERLQQEINLLRQDLGLAFDERDEARSELYRLRKLCARVDAAIHAPYAMAWGDTLAEEIREAAGKGE